MPYGINRVKIQQKLENEVSKPTLAVSGNTTGRVGLLEQKACHAPSGRLTRAVSTDIGALVISLFSSSKCLLLTRPMVGNMGRRVRTTVLSYFLLPTGPERPICLSIPLVHLLTPETKRTITKGHKMEYDDAYNM